MVNSAVTVHDLVVRRGGRDVLRGVSCSIATGMVTGLLGPSGCGKTTFIRSIIGVQRVSSGSVNVLGRPAGTPSLRAEIGYASQSAAVYLDLTVLENVRYFATAVRARHSDVDRVIQEVGLSRHAHRLTGSLSGGERSRVSLAVALLGTPKLLALDEPTVGLDPVLREELWQLFARLASDGITLLVSSHVMDEAERCHELLLMRDGGLLAQESPHELKRRTHTADMDAAFLQVISAAEMAA
jgi:ABC-2 type transport system ATP-binding protein